ncbi:glutamyl-tRNA reductase [Persicimonas caeni]|uniref:Glutamyl-tRNA reductase n=1 Tax=Persicimonas caeni TaxID=2292766 RepID=A0A4Y6Q2M3_PERCE|nr:glutamyl-tRNA reductase [Persicimonas caeni]QDG54255.1 glutamyl-tRNA reductase [Persicimonas caeni]QED35476.1 glutamyl-tRNA reductase [Persicimonas caeni]
MSRSSILKAYTFSYKNTSLEDRDALAFSSENVATFVARVRDELDGEGAVISTCNRTEFYVFGPRANAGWEQVRALVADIKGMRVSQIPQPHGLSGNDAATHIFRVAASLESLALGENQILGQVKDAHEILLGQPVKTPALDRLFQYAVRCGKEVRTETSLCEGTVSISSVAVQLAEKIFGNFAKRQILFIGAGDTAEKAAIHFQEAGAKNFVVVNRSEGKGRAFAHQLGGSYRPLEDIPEACIDADIVLVATGSQDYLVTKKMFKKVMKKRHRRSIFLIDISNPRNIDPAVGDMSGVYLYNMDNLQRVVADNLDARRQEIPAAEKIVAHFVSEWDNWLQSLQVTPTIATLAKYFDAVREQELDRHGGSVDDDDRVMLEEFSKGLIKKLLHHPIMYLRSSVQNNSLTAEDLRVVRSLYNLEDFDDGSE